jgi:hypothetical protein
MLLAVVPFFHVFGILMLVVGATAAWLWFWFPPRRSERAQAQAQAPSPSRTRGVQLCQVNPAKTEADTDIDVIAIHGLDIESPGTWT